jgi:uncharacterized protein YlxP (DUF503 family)
MLIGLLQVDLRLQDAVSVNSKRGLLRSLQDRWRHDFGATVAEVDRAENPVASVLAAALIGNDARWLETQLARMVETAKRQRDIDLVDYRIELLEGHGA